MKATITDNGLILITAENELESYALNKWSEDFLKRTDIPEDIPIAITTFETT